MSSLKKALLWAVSVIFVSATSYAGESGHVPISLYTHTFPHIAELKPAPDSFQLAKATFLPEASEDFDFSGASSNNNHNRGDNCDGYPFSACPTGGSCSPCPFNHRKLRVTGCQSPYLYQNGNCNCPPEKPLSCANDKCTQYCGSTCIAKSCSPTADQTNCTNGNQACDDGCCGTNRKCCVPCTDKITGKPSNSSYTYSSCTDGSGSHSIQTGWKCNSGYHQSGSSCEKDCIVQNCSGYTLSTCPTYGICSSCTKTAASCSTNGTYRKLDSCQSGYKVSGNTCVKAEANIGDILYSDMSTSSEIISGKTPIGVVFDPKRLLAIALISEKQKWSTTTFDLPGLKNYTSGNDADKDFDGKNNTKIIVNYCQSNSKDCPAANYAYKYSTAGTKPQDWYLPATGELSLIYDRKTTLNSTLSKLGAMTLADYHWASNEYNEYSAWFRNISSGGMGGNQKIATYSSVRPIINFPDQACSGYSLSSCPANGNCSSCTIASTNETKWKLESCEIKYTMTNNSCEYSGYQSYMLSQWNTYCNYGEGCGGSALCTCEDGTSKTVSAWLAGDESSVDEYSVESELDYSCDYFCN